MAGISTRLAHAWNAFRSDETRSYKTHRSSLGPSSYSRPDGKRLFPTTEKTIVASIYTRIALDAAAIHIEHCRVDTETDSYLSKMKSGLNECLNVSANIDQSGSHLRRDIFLSLLGLGDIGIVPVETDLDPIESGSWDIQKLRVGQIIEYFPDDVTVRLYDERDGRSYDITLPKRTVAIVENPFYGVMNEPNSTLKRLVHKLSLMDHVDEISSQGKLDLIIQLPYAVKTDTKRAEARRRIEQIQDQLENNNYGIAYADGTEKITQLNRSVENHLLTQVQYLKDELYNELGLTTGIMDGTASDVEMLNYINRTIEPLLDAVVDEMKRKFLTKTARTQGQSIKYFQSPFKLMPISQLANIVDVLSRNQIITPNEIRPTLGLKPSTQPQADQLINSNMPLDDQVTGLDEEGVETDSEEVDEEEAELDAEMAELGLR